MAVVVVEDNATRVDTLEGAPTITGINVGGSGAKELVTFYQGAASASAKATSGTKDAGFWVTSAATHDVTAAATSVWMVKFFISDGADLDADGMKLRAGSASTAYYETYVYDDGTARGTYPPTTSWIMLPWAPNMAEWRDNTTGSPTTTAFDEWAITGQWVTGGAKSENVFLDAIDLSNGLWLTRGDGTDPDGTFEDFWTDDEGDTATTTGRYGHFSKPNELDGVYQCFGTFVIGRTQGGSTANATVFNDANKTLVFPGGRVDTDWNKLELDITNASTVITIASCTFIGVSTRQGISQRFRTAAGTVGTAPGIDVTPDEIEFDTGATGLVPHGFVTGQPLLYSKEGGSAATGLTDATVYYAVEGSTTTRLGLATTRVNAYAGTLIALTATAGEEHSLLTDIITRPNFLVTNGGTPGSAAINSCGFVGWDTFTLTVGITFTGGSIIGARLVDMNSATNNGGTLDGVSFSEMINDVGDALIVADTLANIDNCDFTHYVQGGDADGTFNRSGHAIEINTAGSYNFDGNTFSGYGPKVQSFLTSQAFTGEQININSHPYTTGDPVYYHRDGGLQSIGLTDGALYYVRSVDANNITLHPSWADATENANTENLTTSGAETHLLYSGFAAIVNTSGGAVTINVGSGGSDPSIRNVGASTTSVVLNPVTALVNVKDENDANLQNARVYLKAANGTGPMPYEDSVTISRSSTTATVTHTSHGMETGDKVVIKGITDKTEDNNGVKTITVVDANTYTYTTTDSGSTSYTGTIISTWVAIEALTDASGNASRVKSYSSDQPVNGWVRMSTSTPRYKSNSIPLGTIDSADGLTVNLKMILDE